MNTHHHRVWLVWLVIALLARSNSCFLCCSSYPFSNIVPILASYTTILTHFLYKQPLVHTLRSHKAD
ncbi:hypothetical protein PVAP13_1NG128795 [Panicum virgatum]|uniref:Secreted protein n=1 Tax=Panicum virgatum TaxID=38727 RepID=A0A8T0WQX1_PANVG|nr:hypothetical protein PVAP13_1NG128795 [Panicum virgatum]